MLIHSMVILLVKNCRRINITVWYSISLYIGRVICFTNFDLFGFKFSGNVKEGYIYNLKLSFSNSGVYKYGWKLIFITSADFIKIFSKTGRNYYLF